MNTLLYEYYERDDNEEFELSDSFRLIPSEVDDEMINNIIKEIDNDVNNDIENDVMNDVNTEEEEDEVNRCYLDWKIFDEVLENEYIIIDNGYVDDKGNYLKSDY